VGFYPAGAVSPGGAAGGLVLAGTYPDPTWKSAAPVTYSPGAPAATASTTEVMMGLGATCVYTPAGSGVVVVNVTGVARSVTGQAAVTVAGRFGTGGAPGNGVAVTGTVFGPTADPAIQGSGAGAYTTFAISGLLALVAGTPYWFDLALATSSALDSANLSSISTTFFELP
jgi:hypothetical protein